MRTTTIALLLFSIFLAALPVRAEDVPASPTAARGPVILPVLPPEPAAPVVPPAAIVAPPLCTPSPKPVPAWANYIAWGLESATAIFAVVMATVQRAP